MTNLGQNDSRPSDYTRGLEHGALEILDHLDGVATNAPDGNYSGPIPAELREWIDAIRTNLGVSSPMLPDLCSGLARSGEPAS
jgi:hypothetical protein